jgi:hypothetical protein
MSENTPLSDQDTASSPGQDTISSQEMATVHETKVIKKSAGPRDEKEIPLRSGEDRSYAFPVYVAFPALDTANRVGRTLRYGTRGFGDLLADMSGQKVPKPIWYRPEEPVLCDAECIIVANLKKDIENAKAANNDHTKFRPAGIKLLNMGPNSIRQHVLAAYLRFPWVEQMLTYARTKGNVFCFSRILDEESGLGCLWVPWKLACIYITFHGTQRCPFLLSMGSRLRKAGFHGLQRGVRGKGY